MKSLLHYQLRSATLRQDIIKQDFWAHLLPPYALTRSITEEYDYWFSFWVALPDSPAIQTGLFNDICNLMDDMQGDLLDAYDDNKENDDIPF